jgi:hypothetical protein
VPKCFVMQPFDKGLFDKRYKEIFEPSIINSGLDPYRVDRDPGANIPIDNIERGIQDAELCFAEITSDNPNVWFELGYAIASRKDVVLVCSMERKTPFPFDVQHRNIIKYDTGAPSDYEQLGTKITERIRAILDKEDRLQKLSSAPVVETEGLAQHEIVCLVAIMQNEAISATYPSGLRIKQDMINSGFTVTAFGLACKKLLLKRMVEYKEWQDSSSHIWKIFHTTALGTDWLFKNQDKLVLKKKSEDELPF